MLGKYIMKTRDRKHKTIKNTSQAIKPIVFLQWGVLFTLVFSSFYPSSRFEKIRQHNPKTNQDRQEDKSNF